MLTKRFGIRLLFLLTPASLTLPFWAGRAAAQQSQNMPFTVEGKVIKAESGKLTLGTEDNIVFYVRYDEQTKITRADGSPGQSTDLREGIFVNVKGDLNENGDVIAKTIQIESEKTKGNEQPPPAHSNANGHRGLAPHSARLLPLAFLTALR